MNYPALIDLEKVPKLNHQLPPSPSGLTSAEVAERIAKGETNAVRQRFDRCSGYFSHLGR